MSPCPLPTKRHILRDRRSSTTACPGCWAMGGTQSKKVCGEEKYFVLGRLEQPRQDKKSLVPARRDRCTIQGRTPFHLYSVSPHLVQFQQSAGVTPLWARRSPNGLDVQVGVNRNRPLLTHGVVGDTAHRLHHVSTLLVTGED